MWNVPEIPRYQEMDIARATAQLEELIERMKVEQEEQEEQLRAERMKVEQEIRLRAEQEIRLRAEQEIRLRAEQETLSVLLTTRFPGINGEQAVLERSLLKLGLPKATRMLMTMSLQELLDAVSKGPPEGGA